MNFLFDFLLYLYISDHFFIRLRLLRDNIKIEELLTIIKEFRLLIVLAS